jgi:hypothetical protein
MGGSEKSYESSPLESRGSSNRRNSFNKVRLDYAETNTKQCIYL